MGQSHLNIHTWYIDSVGSWREKSSRQNENFAMPGPEAPNRTPYDVVVDTREEVVAD